MLKDKIITTPARIMRKHNKYGHASDSDDDEHQLGEEPKKPKKPKPNQCECGEEGGRWWECEQAKWYPDEHRLVMEDGEMTQLWYELEEKYDEEMYQDELRRQQDEEEKEEEREKTRMTLEKMLRVRMLILSILRARMVMD